MAFTLNNDVYFKEFKGEKQVATFWLFIPKNVSYIDVVS